MRTMSALDNALVLAPYGQQSAWAKVEISTDLTGSSWVEVSDWNGLDFVRSVTYGESLDSPGWSCKVQLAAYLRDNPSLSLSPGMSGSIVNAGGIVCQPSHRIRISTSVVPMGYKPSTYNKVFEGRIDSWSQQGQSLELTCRDMICDLQDGFIQTSLGYGAEDPGTATAQHIEEVIQNLLDDHINTTVSLPRTSALSSRTTDGIPWQLYSAQGDSTTPWNAADNTNATIRLYTQQMETIWSAIERCAQTKALQLRRRWHEGTGIDDFVLVLETPNRASTSEVLTIDPTAMQAKITGASLNRSDIRNIVAIGYQLQGGSRRTYTASDAASKTKYGDRYMRINVGAASQVDTATEAAAMGDGILADVKDPIIQLSVSMPYWWAAQLNDLVAINPDGIHFDAQQKLAIVSRSNTIQQGGAAMTQVTLKGKPSAAARSHISRQRLYEFAQRDIGSPFSSGSTLHPNGNFSNIEDV